jgi:Flp pilus assembly protein TadB
MSSVLSSTLLLTVLLAVGLFFFIRASVKDRTQIVRLVAEQPQELALQQLKDYFTQRAYRLRTEESLQNQLVLEGFVRPSWFLAIFLTLLTAIGIACLVLVLSLVLPQLTTALLGLVLLSPLAGVFYWRGAARPEQITLKVETAETGATGSSLVTVAAHRDELLALQRNLSFKPVEEESAP